MSSLLLPVYKLSWEKTQPENRCGIVFEETKSSDGAVNWTSVYAEAAAQKVLLKSCYEKICRILKETCAGISFLIFHEKLRIIL